MSSFSLNRFPPPSPKRGGWPWFEASPPVPETMPDGSPWPRITVVTPSYNQGQFIEETIRSVLLQGYPNLEYVIMDGGSTDGSIELIKKYEPWLAYWVSEPDRGQAHALNNGFSAATGDLLGWINSDDWLLPDALVQLARAHYQYPDAILLGDLVNYSENLGTGVVTKQRNVTFETILEPWRHDTHWQQPGTFFPAQLFQRVGSLDETLRYVFDWDWMCRALLETDVHYVGIPVAQFRFHSQSKTVGEAAQWSNEEAIVLHRYLEKASKKNNQNASLAAFELHTAITFLRLQNLDRKRGISHLMSAIRFDWSVLVTVNFLILAARAVAPTFILKLVRSAHHYWLYRNLARGGL